MVLFMIKPGSEINFVVQTVYTELKIKTTAAGYRRSFFKSNLKLRQKKI